MNDDEKDYPVGYGRPPDASKFRAGRSGNPKGRPKGARNSSSLLNQALDERVIVKEGGRQKTITKREAAFKQLVNKAAAGDQRAIQLLMNELRQLQQRTDHAPAEPAPLREGELEIMNQLITRIREGETEDGSEESK
jgi:uncharacterized protein DUF5681